MQACRARPPTSRAVIDGVEGEDKATMTLPCAATGRGQDFESGSRPEEAEPTSGSRSVEADHLHTGSHLDSAPLPPGSGGVEVSAEHLHDLVPDEPVVGPGGTDVVQIQVPGLIEDEGAAAVLAGCALVPAEQHPQRRAEG